MNTELSNDVRAIIQWARDGELAAYEIGRGAMDDAVNHLVRENTELRADNERLRAALGPFATSLGGHWANQPDSMPIDAGPGPHDLRIGFTLGEFRKARAALASPAPSDSTPGADDKDAEIARLRQRKDNAYHERNMVVAALAKLYPSGTTRTAIDGWDPEWHGCVRIDLPTGQVSWHYHDSQAYLFAELPLYEGEWDGHTTEEKYARLAALTPGTDWSKLAEKHTDAWDAFVEGGEDADPDELENTRIAIYDAVRREREREKGNDNDNAGA